VQLPFKKGLVRVWLKRKGEEKNKGKGTLLKSRKEPSAQKDGLRWEVRVRGEVRMHTGPHQPKIGGKDISRVGGGGLVSADSRSIWKHKKRDETW